MRSALAAATGVLVAVAGGCSKSSTSAAPPADVGADAAPSSLTSSAFAAGAAIPRTFTCDADDVSPPLAWSGQPAAAKSYALLADDPDAPNGTFTHWVLFDVPASTGALAQASSGVGTAGKNDFGKIGYGGPCPPAGKTHHYSFRLYALDVPTLSLVEGASRADVERAMSGHVAARGELVGTYAR